MTKTSLFNLNTWSSIYCPEAKQSDAVLRRKQSLEELQLPINGVDTQPSGISVITYLSSKFRSQTWLFLSYIFCCRLAPSNKLFAKTEEVIREFFLVFNYC